MDDLYDRDFIAWTELMSAELKKRDARNLDWQHLAEEIRDLGIAQENALRSHLENALLHLIKWEILHQANLDLQIRLRLAEGGAHGGHS